MHLTLVAEQLCFQPSWLLWASSPVPQAPYLTKTWQTVSWQGKKGRVNMFLSANASCVRLCLFTSLRFFFKDAFLLGSFCQAFPPVHEVVLIFDCMHFHFNALLQRKELVSHCSSSSILELFPRIRSLFNASVDLKKTHFMFSGRSSRLSSCYPSNSSHYILLTIRRFRTV